MIFSRMLKAILAKVCEQGGGQSPHTNPPSRPSHGPVAKFIVSDWGDKVDSGVGLSYRRGQATVHRLAGRYDNPMPESTISPSKGLRIWPSSPQISAKELRTGTNGIFSLFAHGIFIALPETC